MTFYDSASNHFYTGTSSATTSLYLAATPELDAFIAQYGVPGDLNSLLFKDANSQLTNPPTILSGLSAEVQAGRQPNPTPPGPIIGRWVYELVTPDNSNPLFPSKPPYWQLTYDPWYIRPAAPTEPVIPGGPIAPTGPIGPLPQVARQPAPRIFTDFIPTDNPFNPPPYIPGVSPPRGVPRPPILAPIEHDPFRPIK